MTDKEKIDTIAKCAKLYMENLNNKNFMFIIRDKGSGVISAIETLFLKENYRHLTGFNPKDKSKESGEEFIDKFITENKTDNNTSIIIKSSIDIDFNDYDFSMVDEKLDVLENLMSIYYNARSCGNFSAQGLDLYTEYCVGNEHASIGFVKDKKLNVFVPNTALEKSIEHITSPHNDVIAVMSKSVYATQYYDLHTISKKVAVELDDTIRAKISIDVLDIIDKQVSKIQYDNIDCEYYYNHIDKIKTLDVAEKVLKYIEKKMLNYKLN